jgi:hypothetical protein
VSFGREPAGAGVGGVGDPAGAAVGAKPTSEQDGKAGYSPGSGVVHRAGHRVAGHDETTVPGRDDPDVESAPAAFPEYTPDV